jgi:hypothetical protein
VDYSTGTFFMSEITRPLADIKEEAARVIEAARQEGFPLRLLFWDSEHERQVDIFIDHDVADDDRAIKAAYISSLTANDWGFQKTLSLNLDKLKALAIEQHYPPQLLERIDTLNAAMEKAPKSMGWRARALVGERVRCYELPEETR